VLPVLVDIHRALGYALILMAILLGLMGGFQFLRRRAVSGGFRSGYLLMALLVVVQGIPGALALFSGGHPKALHFVYGAFAVLFLPGVFVYSRDRKPDTEAMILTIACWVVVIAYFRGFATA